MPSLVCLLSRIFNWQPHAELRGLPALGYLPRDLQALQLPQVAFVPPTCPLPVQQVKRSLRVKWHRDNHMDHTRPPARLVISGRMADVHAELERLAAMEAAA